MELSILQWNVWYKEDVRIIVKFLQDHPADVVCLQELTIQDISETGHAPDYIAKQLGYHHFYKEIDLGKDNQKVKLNIANGIFSRYPLHNTKWEWINIATGTGHYDDEYRAYVGATIHMDGKNLTIATTHMSYTNAFENTPRKEQEADALIDILSSKTQRFIFTGDLNATPEANTVQRVSRILNNIGPDWSAKTWTTKPFSYDGFTETELRWRLDHIFATPDIKLIHSEVLQTDVSDHLPIMSRVTIT